MLKPSRLWCKTAGAPVFRRASHQYDPGKTGTISPRYLLNVEKKKKKNWIDIFSIALECRRRRTGSSIVSIPCDEETVYRNPSKMTSRQSPLQAVIEMDAKLLDVSLKLSATRINLYSFYMSTRKKNGLTSSSYQISPFSHVSIPCDEETVYSNPSKKASRERQVKSLLLQG
ncbi:hypothetical protein CEXT_481981 [Caerostris extrusa]|uniref:Uncharacterized protein n=1 Tax=Caerostris extrusa TaxID=172846 RepID=A0AAV4UFB3_CAEEX|nr:hypothetical protein CEXT_481981 [Caerostris extrusa]